METVDSMGSVSVDTVFCQPSLVGTAWNVQQTRANRLTRVFYQPSLVGTT